MSGCENDTITNETIEWILLFQLAGSIVVPTVYGIVFVVGLVGNATLMYTVLANKAMRTKSNVFIVSLAAGDFLLILVSVPFAALLYMTDGWWYGEAMCKMFEFLQTFSLAVSVLTLTALSGDRLVAIVFPLYVYKSSSMRRTVYAAVSIWLLSFALAIPDLLSANVEDPNGNPFCNAYRDDWGEWYRRFRTMFRFVVLFAIPLIVIAVFYAAIAVTLLCRSRAAYERVRGGEAMLKQLESRRKVANIVLLFVVIFAVCWLPRHVYLISWHFGHVCFDAFWYVFKAMGSCLTFVYSAANPFALYVINDQFRRHFDHYLCGCCCRSRRMPIAAHRRRSTLTSTTTAQVITQNVSLEDLMDRMR